MPASKSTVTTLQIAQASTPVHPLIAALPADSQLERLTQAQCIAQDLPSTSKSFARLGISDDRHIVWAHVNFNLEDHNILEAFCASQDLRTCDLLAKVAMGWFDVNREAITEAADGFVRTEMSIEDLAKKASAAQRTYERAMALIAKMTASGEEDEPAE